MRRTSTKGLPRWRWGTPFMLLATALAQGVGLAWKARVGEEPGPGDREAPK
ncbi:hypothetical protein GCM10018952_01950 [Streptosporangium vulgare]